MAQAWEYIKIALMNIRSNKGRSVLTMLGIIIGITSVIMIMSIGDGVKGQVSDELNAMAGGLIGIYVNNEQSKEKIYFDEDDFDAIREKIDGVKGVTPVYTLYGSVVGKRENLRLTRQAARKVWSFIRQSPLWTEDILRLPIIMPGTGSALLRSRQPKNCLEQRM